MESQKETQQNRIKFYEWYGNELIRKMELIYSADVNNYEAVNLWFSVKDCDWVKPEIREKWEKELSKKINYK